MKLLQSLTLAAALATGHAFSHSPQPVSRRDAVAQVLASAAVAVALPGAALAIEPCPPGSKNCLRQTWTPPAGSSPADAADGFRAALAAYPPGGLEDGKVDGGGYAVVSDTLGKDGGAAVVEFRSSGKGTFAKLFNGGKPFVDDLAVEASGGGFEVRSASRQGESDFGVNAKRLGYLGDLLKAKGWSGVDL